MVRMLD